MPASLMLPPGCSVHFEVYETSDLPVLLPGGLPCKLVQNRAGTRLPRSGVGALGKALKEPFTNLVYLRLQAGVNAIGSARCPVNLGDNSLQHLKYLALRASHIHVCIHSLPSLQHLEITVKYKRCGNVACFGDCIDARDPFALVVGLLGYSLEWPKGALTGGQGIDAIYAESEKIGKMPQVTSCKKRVSSAETRLFFKAVWRWSGDLARCTCGACHPCLTRMGVIQPTMCDNTCT
jgi:hypothetical protein